MRTSRGSGQASAATSPAGHTSSRSLGDRHRHLHGLDHLAAGRRPRCGCGPESVAAEQREVGSTIGNSPIWIPLGRQHTGWRRAHFVYSDRMLLPSR